jgi:SAM-dependent methyltransferase
MFFPQLIKNIQTGDKVLEIGPGAGPHPRSDVFLELKLDSEEEYVKQFGQDKKLQTEKEIVFYDGTKFPFTDKQFDYVICSHVLEHVPDVEYFLSEVFRVSRKGYFEYPLITYEYLFNFDVHFNFLKWDGKKLVYKKKSTTHLNEFRPVQHFFLETLQKEYDTYFKKIPHFFIEGFEWENSFPVSITNDMNELVVHDIEIPVLKPKLADEFGFGELVKAMFKKIIR